MKNANKIYIYDGSIEGLFTITYKCMINDTKPLDVITDMKKLSLFEEYEIINTNYKNSYKIFKSIPKRMGYDTLYNIYNAFLVNKPDKSKCIVNYLISGYKYGNTINKMIALEEVMKVQKYSHMVSREAHKMKGFVRFNENDGVLYSSINPEHDILELLIPHFKKRLSNYTWIIEDVKRKKAVLYKDGKDIVINTSDIDLEKFRNGDYEYKELWKSFIKSVTIAERKNLKCQMNFMPKKYWKYITEMGEENE